MALRRPIFHALDSPSIFPSTFWGGGHSLFQTPAFDQLSQVATYPPVSIEEKSNGFELVAELPGVKREEINVSLGDQNRRIILEGHMTRSTSSGTPGQIKEVEGLQQTDGAGKVQPEQTGLTQAQVGNGGGKNVATRSGGRANYLVDERRVDRQFHRSFTFQTPLNPSTMKAKLEHGMLRVTVEKATQDEGTHTINID